jgi:hypothetical protein
MKIRLVGDEFFHTRTKINVGADRQTDRQTDRHDEANSRFSHLGERA